jgi:hypothetical protein
LMATFAEAGNSCSCSSPNKECSVDCSDDKDACCGCGTTQSQCKCCPSDTSCATSESGGKGYADCIPDS